MPPRKSTDSAATSKPGDGEAQAGPGRGKTQRNSDGLGIEDLNLPRSMVQRLAKGVLPPNTSIQREALMAMSKSATVFVNYLANNANDRAVLKNKRTIQPNDVFDALDELEFPDFLPRVKTELGIWNTAQCDKRNSYRRRLREEATAAKGGDGVKDDSDATEDVATNGLHQDGSAPAVKKTRLSSGAVAADGEGDMLEDPDDGDETIDENEDDEDDDNVDDNVDEDEDVEEGPPDDREDGLEGDMDHNIDQDEHDGNESD